MAATTTTVMSWLKRRRPVQVQVPASCSNKFFTLFSTMAHTRDGRKQQQQQRESQLLTYWQSHKQRQEQEQSQSQRQREPQLLSLSSPSPRWNNKATTSSILMRPKSHDTFFQSSLYALDSSYYMRSYSSTSSVLATAGESADEDELPRESMAFDVLIVGGGPAGLAAAIRLKQLCQEHDNDLSVCLIDKGSEIGAHILSGNVFDPKALYELFPQYKKNDDDDDDDKTYWTEAYHQATSQTATPVERDCFQVLTESGQAYTIPNVLLPSQLHNDGNYIISLSQLCRWLAMEAEELGVEIYPGFSASEVVFSSDSSSDTGGGGGGGVIGIATRDVGIAKDGTHKSTFERGVELHARQTIFAEGARGSCSEFLMQHFNLRSEKSDHDDKKTEVHAQTYGLGIKEVWEIPEENFQKGLVQHTLGFPLQSSLTDKVFGGSFLYHLEPNLVLAGLVVGLDYKNPYLNPYKEFQKWKTHPEIAKHFKDGTCISYGARVLNEGGYHAIPKLTFPGGALIGCSAGFLNAVKIKGTHTAMKSGMLAAEAVFDGLAGKTTAGGVSVAETGELDDAHVPQEMKDYSRKIEESWIREELYQVRNCHQAFSEWGVGGGVVYTGLAAHITKGREPWTIEHNEKDCDTTMPAATAKKIDYPPPDNVLTFDLLTNLQRSGTFHEDDQPAHLRIKPECATIPQLESFPVYDGPEQRFCPAGVYEYVDDNGDGDNGDGDLSTTSTAKDKKRLVINAQVSPCTVHVL